MEKFKIKLDKIEDLKKFVNACSTIKGDVVVPQGKFIIDAKSILGMLSLDLSKELTVEVESEYLNELFEKIKEIG